MQRTFRVLALVILLVTLGVWVATGMHRGWSRTSVTEMQRDEITGIDFPVQRAKFVAGAEFLGVGVALSVAMASLSFIGRRAQSQTLA